MERDLSEPEHLPNRRPDRRPPHPSWLPKQRRGITPQMIGRYPDFDVFDAEDTWDAATTRVVRARLDVGRGGLRFFRAAEAPTLRAFCDVCMDQHEDPRVPVAELIDEKLATGVLDGYQYADMPDDRDTWHLVLAGLDEAAEHAAGCRFADLALAEQEIIVGHLADGSLTGGSWDQLDVRPAWSVCMRSILEAFYSHPWAWNEIGFGGPAYPRGFMRLGPTGMREPFERRGANAIDPVRVAPELER